MSDSDPDRIDRLERRVAELEARLTALGAGPGPTVAATISQPPPAVAPDVARTSLWATGGATVPPTQPVAAPRPLAATPVRPAPRPAGPPVGWGAYPTAVPTTTAPVVARTAPPKRPASRSLAQLEEQLSSRLLAWTGGIALVLGAVFFLSLAFSRGWIGPEARVLIGLVAGAAGLLAGTWLFGRGDRTPATVLAGVGVGTSSLAIFAASNLFGLIPVEVALVGYFILAIGTAAIALYANSQAVVAFGIVATTIAPPILDAPADLVTVAYLAAALIGTALISLRRSWPLLALLAFVATAPQAAIWFRGESSTALVIAGIGAFWAINALAASGSSLARLQPSVHLASATLLTLNALFAIVSLHAFLPADAIVRMGALLVLASLHGALALVLLVPPPGRHPFGVLAAGIAAGTLAIGMAIELGGVASPIGNTVLATVVAWVAIRFRDAAAAAVASAIASLAVLHLVVVEYRLDMFADTIREGWPFVSPEGIVAIVMAASSLLVGGVAWRSFRKSPPASGPATADLALVGGCLGAIAVIAYATYFETTVPVRIMIWSTLAVAMVGVAAFVRRDRAPAAWDAAVFGGAILMIFAGLATLADVIRPGRLVVESERGAATLPLTVLATVVALAAIRLRDAPGAALAATIGSLAAVYFVGVWYPLGRFADTVPDGWPFVSPEGIVAIVMAAALLLVGGVAWRSFKIQPPPTAPWAASVAFAGGCLGAIAVIAYATAFETTAALAVVIWSLLAIAAFAVAVFVRSARPMWAWTAAITGGATLIFIATIRTLAEVARPTRLLVDPDRGSAIVPLFNVDTIALAALAFAIAFFGQVVKRWSPPETSASRNDSWAAGATLTAGAIVLYLASIAIVDAFQGRVGSGGDPDEIATQAQVVLSIFWVLVGAGLFGTGLVYRIGLARVFGLGLLAVATAKVFLFDLAALDVAYRVLSFIGLGGVLLASSFVAARFRAPTGPSVEDR
jgi:uncharacterized membrane protein